MLRPLAVPAVALALVAAACGEQRQGATRTQVVTVEVGRPTQADADGSREAAARGGAAPEVPGDARCDGSTQPAAELGERDHETTIRCLLNAAREQEGLPALGPSEVLARAAATRSQDMAEEDYFSHVSPDGQDVERVVRGTGWIPDDRSWLLGENIGWAPEGATSPADLVRGWLDSPRHRENIMNEQFTEVGVGSVLGAPQAGTDGVTSTTIFGVRGAGARG